jgi:hypothetical protein
MPSPPHIRNPKKEFQKLELDKIGTPAKPPSTEKRGVKGRPGQRPMPTYEEVAAEEKPPFDGPYKKTPKVVTDKSGAKHDPMSRARDLARQAAKRQSGLKKESLDESRKAEIVKEIMKGKKKQTAEKFEPNPELQSTVVKSDN